MPTDDDLDALRSLIEGFEGAPTDGIHIWRFVAGLRPDARSQATVTEFQVAWTRLERLLVPGSGTRSDGATVETARRAALRAFDRIGGELSN